MYSAGEHKKKKKKKAKNPSFSSLLTASTTL